MPDRAPRHFGGGRLETPLRCRRDHPATHVIANRLGVGILAAADGIEQVPLADDRGPGQRLVNDYRGADALLAHSCRSLTKGVRGPDRARDLRHSISNFHGRLLSCVVSTRSRG